MICQPDLEWVEVATGHAVELRCLVVDAGRRDVFARGTGDGPLKLSGGQVRGSEFDVRDPGFDCLGNPAIRFARRRKPDFRDIWRRNILSAVCPEGVLTGAFPARGYGGPSVDNSLSERKIVLDRLIAIAPRQVLALMIL